jgi:hypothetical protein
MRRRDRQTRSPCSPRDVWFQTRVWIKHLAPKRQWSDGHGWAQGPPDRCDLAGRTIHPFDECEAVSQDHGSHRNGVQGEAPHTHSPSPLALGASSQPAWWFLPSLPSNKLHDAVLSSGFPDPALSPCHRLQSSYLPPTARAPRPQYLHLINHTAALTVSQSICSRC